MIAALAVALTALWGPAPQAAPRTPTDTLRGVVVSGPDSLPVAGATVVLHRVTPDTGFAVDSARSAPDGRFLLPVRRDPEAVLLASVRHEGALYFGPALHGADLPEEYRITVFPSRATRAGERPAVAGRTLVVSAEDGHLRMLDAVDVTAPGDTTLVGSGPGGEAWWRISLPEGVRNVRVLPGGVAPEEVELDAGQARVSAPVPASGQRLLLGYEAPAGATVSLTPGGGVGRLEVVVRGDEPGVSVEGLGEGRAARVGQGAIRRYVGEGVGPGDTVRITLVRAGGGGVRGAWIAVGVGVVLALGAAASWRGRA